MTCQECEDLLAAEETSAKLDRHLAEYSECWELAADLRANADAFREMTAMPPPSVRGAVLGQVRARETRRQVARWGWALAAAATIVVVFLGTRPVPVEPLPPVISAKALAHGVVKRAATPVVNTHRKRQATRSPAPQEPLKIKMFTSDPDVVIYWLVEPKEGSE